MWPADLMMGSMQNTWRLNWYLSEFPEQPTKQENGKCACSRSATDLKFKTGGLEGCSGNADLTVLAWSCLLHTDPPSTLVSVCDCSAVLDVDLLTKKKGLVCFTASEGSKHYDLPAMLVCVSTAPGSLNSVLLLNSALAGDQALNTWVFGEYFRLKL